MDTLIGLFTGTSKWLYIALVVCGLGFFSTSALSISLFADKTALKNTVETQSKELTKKANEIKALQDTLVVKRGEIEAQNARIKQMEVDKKANEEKAEKEKALIQTKYENLRNSLNFKVDENASNANDVKLFVNGFHWVR